MLPGNWPNLSDAFFVSSRNNLLDRLLAEPSLRMFLVAAAVLAHFGLRLTFYNRLNSMGWKRATIKRTEKIAFVETWFTPCVMGWLYGSDVWDWIHGDVTVISLPAWVIAYAIACSVLGLVFGSLWLLWRPIFRVHHVPVVREVQVHDVVNRTGRSLARTRKCRWAAKLPFNQIFQMSVEQIELPVVGLPDELDGYKVAHLSDIHLTGQVEPEFTQHAISAANEWRPDLFALTGDIVDKQPCVAWLHDLFSKASASDGCYFVLGNHDTRISDPDVVRERMKGAGWIDVGGLVHSTRLRSVSCALSGNEYPWFSRPSEQAMRGADAEFRFCVSHSPDQFDWCRRNQVDLMLAGHTHGGQGRLPIAGPILSPSWHGSRWASGDFYRAPTTLHVSRGLSGVHLLRINCRPELSLITLRCSHA
ncbi:metallophosphoesterase [Rhodopirellula halodulae]|uniref:metallophosphoesterase n=1 Tax=Rhodopirellula halodulae TaxID=2894198 RepID=UPI001E487458|nr:metallophosphoesterase [Rhodopirellula sp. JC737]